VTAVPLLPDNAPFTPEQRAWLNGFFAGLLSGDAGSARLGDAPTPTIPEAAEEFPWHDPALALDERLNMAQGRPRPRLLMAAMAQLDCGQCGYQCQTYAEALASGAETKLSLCVPGGKETSRTLKRLMDDAPLVPLAAPAVLAVTGPQTASAPETSRNHPAAIEFLSRRRLNRDGSGKTTNHIDLNLNGSRLDYAVGDSLGLYPSNDPALVDAVIAAIGAEPDFPIVDQPLRQVLIGDMSLGAVPDALFHLISYLTGGERRNKARALAAGADPDGDAATLDVLAAIDKFRGIRPDPEAFVEALEPLQPRLYSIASSPRADAGRISLTVDAVRYPVRDRTRLGVASTFLGERIAPGDTVKAFIQRAAHFALPADSARPIIMIGPGTGIAPFRAFLRERQAVGASGKTWLFFGHRSRATDFFYEEEIEGLRKAGTLTRLDLAFSRDQAGKLYVQHRMRENAAELWSWLDAGAHVYVCGDAKNMARDVDQELQSIVTGHGRMAPPAAKAFMAGLAKDGRYQRDVY